MWCSHIKQMLLHHYFIKATDLMNFHYKKGRMSSLKVNEIIPVNFLREFSNGKHTLLLKRWRATGIHASGLRSFATRCQLCSISRRLASHRELTLRHTGVWLSDNSSTLSIRCASVRCYHMKTHSHAIMKWNDTWTSSWIICAGGAWRRLQNLSAHCGA